MSIFEPLYLEAYIQSMSISANFVSLHPYFTARPGKIETVKAALRHFVEKTASEEENLFYGFSINGDEIFCREAYESANGLLAHLDNVGTLLTEMLKSANLTRVEVHGPAKELDKLKEPLAHLNPVWFTLEASLSR